MDSRRETYNMEIDVTHGTVGVYGIEGEEHRLGIDLHYLMYNRVLES